MISVTKLGVTYAAYAGVRSATVWSSAKPASVRDERIEQAVLTALAPFTLDRNDSRIPNPGALLLGQELRVAYVRLINGADASRTIPAASVVRRYRYAASKTSTSRTDSGGGKTSVEVTYRYRCWLGVAGRILDPDHSSPFEIVIKSTAEIPSETPPTGSLGIDYHSE